MSAIGIEQVRLGYDRAVVLDGISLDVPDGTVLTLVGPSGSGKTTLLRAVAGFLRPQAGRITSGNRVLVGPGTDVPPERRSLAMVFQHHAVWPHLSVADNVAYPLRRQRVATAERRTRVREALEVVGLADLADRRPPTLSGGQRQRVALARAIVARPAALLLDEALSSLDEPLRASLRLTLRELAQDQGLTMIHVTHDRDEALALADRIAVLDRGRVAQVGPPQDIVDSPATPAVARFLHDAVLLTGRMGPGGFHADEGGAYLPRASLSLPAGEVSGPATVALLPQGTAVLAGADTGPGGSGSDVSGSADTGPGLLVPATVRASLYGRTSTSVVCEWQGRQVGAHSEGVPPRPGQTVRLRVDHAVVYPPEGPGR